MLGSREGSIFWSKVAVLLIEKQPFEVQGLFLKEILALVEKTYQSESLGLQSAGHEAFHGLILVFQNDLSCELKSLLNQELVLVFKRCISSMSGNMIITALELLGSFLILADDPSAIIPSSIANILEKSILN